MGVVEGLDRATGKTNYLPILFAWKKTTSKQQPFVVDDQNAWNDYKESMIHLCVSTGHDYLRIDPLETFPQAELQGR